MKYTPALWGAVVLLATCVAVRPLQHSANEMMASLVASERQWLHHRRSYRDHKKKTHFDFIVVGSGAAGSVLANRLSEKWQVLLLEAGGEDTPSMYIPGLWESLLDTDADWSFRTIPQKNTCTMFVDSICPYHQGKVLGGGTSMNGMIMVRGHRKDFDAWGDIDANWNFNEILPYFHKVENTSIPMLQRSPYHGTDGTMRNSNANYHSPMSNTILQACQDLGLKLVDYNGESQTGVSRVHTATFEGRRWGIVTGYLEEAMKRSNLFIKTGALVTNLVVDGTRVLGVKYKWQGDDYKAIADKEVLLAAGAVNTPKLLMLSGIGPKSDLESLGIPLVKDLSVGLNLMDHPTFVMILFTLEKKLAYTKSEILKNMNFFIEEVVNKTGPLSSPGNFEVVSFSDLENTPYYAHDWPPVEIIHHSVSPFLELKSARSFGFTDETYRKVFEPLRPSSTYQAYISLMRPTSKGSLRLVSRDPNDPPEIDPRMLSDPEEVDTILAGVKEIIEIANTPTMQGLGMKLVEMDLPGCEEFQFGSDDFWRCAIRGYSFLNRHVSGTCKMGNESDPTAVVTPDLSVRGMTGLRVVDSSVLPTIISGHLQLIIHAIAEKAADIIKAKYVNK